MRDADGDLDTATLTLTITGSNDVPQITVDPGNQGANDQVFEAGLATGSNAAGTGEFASGSFSLSDADGLDDLQSVTINGVTVALGSLVGSVFAGSHGNLTVTAYNPATGVASYSYQLTSPTTDGPGVESDTFSLSVSDGTASSVPASIVIEIVDDLPNAVNDVNSQVEDSPLAITGNVLSNDLHPNGQPGADTPTSFVAWSSTVASYGSFSDTGSGTYSYLLNNGSAAVQALDMGETLTETFTYSMRDADGDLDTATLIITITGSNDVPQITVDPGNQGANDQVFESALATGSNAVGNGEFASGSFTLTDVDGLDDLQSVSINGTIVVLGSLVGSVFAGGHGNLTITAYNPATGVASYSYQLTSPTIDAPGTETDVFSLSVSDGSAWSTTAFIVLEIVDDQPNAVNDGNSVVEGSLVAITGNVLSNDLHPNGQPGADTPTSFMGWGSVIGTYGTFTDTGNGTYSYSLNNANVAVQALEVGQTLTETFTYSMRDADGDLDTAVLTITIIGSNDVPQVTVDPGNQGANDQVFEAGLASGSNAPSNSEFATGTFTLSDADGLADLQSVTLNGVTVGIGSLAGSVFAGGHGTLTVTGYNPATGVATYTYQLTNPTTDGPGIETDTFSLSVFDGTASSVPASIVIEIIDDLPVAYSDSNSLAEGGVVGGNVLGNDVMGADGPLAGGAVVGVRTGGDTSTPAAGAVGTSLSGTYGTLQLNADGSYTYTGTPNLVPPSGATEVFTYTISDADGDLSTTTLTLTLTDSGMLAANDLDALVHENALDLVQGGADLAPGTVTGSLPGSALETDSSNTLVGAVSGGVGAITYALVGSATGAFGVIHINPDGSYVYTLTGPAETMPNANNGTDQVITETFTYSATDANGNSAMGSILVTIVDDVPTLGDFTPASLPNEVGTVNGVFVLEAGADGLAGFQISGPPLSGVTYSSVNNFDGLGGFVSTTLTATGPGSVTLFTLTVNADETYSFNLVTPEATTTETVSLLNLTAGGPQPWVETADGRIEFTGNSTGVNSSTQGFGVANQFLGVGESFTMEFHNPGAVGNDAPGSSPQLVDSVLLTNNSVNGSLTIQWTATNTTTGVVQTGTVAVSGSTTNIDPSISFNQLEISGVSGSGQGVRFSSATVSTSILPEDQNLTFNIVAQDGDGDMDGATLVVDIVVTADPNLAPDALNDSATTLQGVPVTIDVLANDSDANGNPLNIVSVSNSAPVYGTTAIVNGQIVYTPTTNPGPGGLTDQFTYTISDGQGGGDTATVTVTITDALPTAVADTTTPGATRTESVNLILVLDSSGSISNSQMTLIKGAVTNLISTYGAALVKVMLVDFDDSATVFTSSGSAWLTGAAATSIINSSSITNGGGTDYDSAIAAVQSSFAGAPLADKTYMYFLSDGEPTGNDGSNDNSISAAERTAWVNFASNSGGAVPRIHEVYSVGIGSGSLTTQLNQVAWSSTGGSNVFIISSVSQLSGTLTQISDSSTGNVTSNDLPGADGWATARLVSVTYGATTYNFNAGDAINNEVTIALGATQGTLIIRENGTYTYTPPSAGASGADVSVTYVIRDADGSTSSATLTVDIAPLAPAPLAATSSFAFTEEPDGLLMDGDDDEGAGMQALGVSGPAPESELADAGSLTDAPTPDEQSQLLVDGSQPDDPDPSLEGPAGDTLPLAAELASLLEPQDDSADPTLDSDLLMAADDQGAAAGYTQVHVESIADVYLDLASLLVGETDDVNVLSQYLSFSVSATSTSIGISPLGDGAVSQGVELQGIDLASHYGVGTEAGGLVADANEATIIQGLLGDGALHVDTV
ncbi:MAG: Ig-like domain-containing protein [Pseudomonas sp.]|uniref:Ig-like domain-containing protein n=1 Tax=Pseudomonas sp. TaxID=306 RepID=UPI0033969162